MQASEIIRQLGGSTAVARILQKGRTAVSNWGSDGIPGRYWPSLARYSQEIGASVTMDVLENHTTKLRPGRDGAPEQASGHAAGGAE